MAGDSAVKLGERLEVSQKAELFEYVELSSGDCIEMEFVNESTFSNEIHYSVTKLVN